MTDYIKLPFSTDSDGVVYNLYLYEYFHDNKTLAGYLYASSMEEAELSLASIKSSAHVSGCIEGVM